MSETKKITMLYFQDLYERGLTVPEMAKDLSNYTGKTITNGDVRYIATSYNFNLRAKKRKTNEKTPKFELESVTNNVTSENVGVYNAPQTVVLED